MGTTETNERQQIGHQREYVWGYFQLHSSQRLTAFNFYIVISTAIAAGYIFALGVYSIPAIAVPLGFTVSLLSFVFWKLDVRNRQLIKNAEEALKYLEDFTSTGGDKDQCEALKVFTYEEKQTNRMKARRSFWPWKNYYSYSVCFNMVFVVFGISGFVGAIYAAVINFSA